MIKNILSLSTLACACSLAVAQSESSVNLYGSVDAGVSRVTGLKGGTDNKVVSGIMDGSRWGLRGNEVIGNGFRGIFTLESRLEVNNGTMSNRPASGSQVPDRFINAAAAALAPIPVTTLPAANKAAIVAGAAKGIADKVFGVNVDPPNAVFDRQAFVGLVTPVGAVLVGRQYTPAYEVAATFDTLQTQSSLAAGQVASFPPSIDIRVSNAVAYRFEKGPFSGGLMYTVEPAPSVSTLKGGSFMYKSEAASVGLGYNTHKNELGEKALTSTVIGAMVKIGPGYLSGLVGKVKDDHPAGLSVISPLLVSQAVPKSVADLVQGAFIGVAKQDARLTHIGYRLTAGASTVYVAYSSYNDKLANNADTASYGAVYSYALSKRTDLSAVVTRFNNKGTGQAAPGNAGYLGGVTEKAGTDSSNVAFGIRHRF
jgi:general bacterial porin, GBP family